MLSAEKNRLLTEVGPGTPMGELLRRYWMPIGGVTEFDTVAIKPIRLFGEDLVLYKDLGGTFGLLDRHCPHRRADLSYGMVERTGLRCNYHGWLMDEAGRCIEQPYDDIANPSQRGREALRDPRLSGPGGGRSPLGLSRPGSRRPSCRSGSRSPGATALPRS